jgi:CheY-like chemotaxis protein
MRILLVEDDPQRRYWFTKMNIGRVMDVTDDVEEAKRLIDTHEYDQIFLDHDLSEEHYMVWREGTDKHDATTGYAVAKYLAENPDKSPNAEIVVHSLNPVGSDRMWRKMKETRRTVHKIPYLQLVQANS